MMHLLHDHVGVKTADGILDGVICGRTLFKIRKPHHYDVKIRTAILFNQPEENIISKSNNGEIK